MEKIQEIELFIKDENKDGVFAISLVDEPAIEEDFVYLSKQEIELKVVDEEKRIVVGYALIPDKRIYRKVKPKGHDKEVEFNIYFSAETVEKTSELFMKKLYANNITSDHKKPVQGVSVIESWITEDAKNDKVNLYGIKPIVGGWAVKMKIYNDEEWQKVKDGEYNGFSIEGVYEGFEQLQFELVQSEEEIILDELKKLIGE